MRLPQSIDFSDLAEKGRLNTLPRSKLNRLNLCELNNNGLAPLHLAAKHGHLDQIPKDLLKYTLHAPCKDGFTLMIYAGHAGFMDQLTGL